MSTIINATTTNGVVIQPDNSGSLALQSNGTTMASATSSGFNIGGAVASGFTMKNRIINGAMVINQRAASVTSDAYTVDRFKYGAGQASKATVAQSSIAPAGFVYSLGVTSSSSYSVLSTDVFGIFQYIEGYNFANLNFGTANAQTVTLSFWVRSSLTGTFGGSILNYAGNRSYPFTYTISTTNAWEQKSITIAGDTSGTWIGATNAGAAIVCLGLGTGSTYSGSSGSWTSNQYYSATGATSVVGTNGATLYITGIQLEAGSQATSFEYRPIDAEFASCQRYYIGDGTTYYSQGAVDGAYNTEGMFINLPIQMRTDPTVVAYGWSKGGHINGSNTSNPANANVAASPTSFLLRWASGSPAYRAYGYYGTINPYLSAEL